MRDRLAACLLLVAVAACGSNLGPGATPKETIRNFELALKSLDIGATYDMLSSRQRAQFDTMLTAVKASLANVPEGMLKEAGLDARSVGPDQMRVVLQKVLPAELEARAVENASGVCDSLQNGLKSFTPSDAATADATPDAVFKRLAGG